MSLLENYLAEIQRSRSSTLEELLEGYLCRFVYNNSNLVVEGQNPEILSRVVGPLSPSGIFSQFLGPLKGGYCYQISELQYFVLTELGFKVTRHASITLKTLSSLVDHSSVLSRPVVHELLIVREEGNSDLNLIDVAFGSNLLRAPLRFSIDEPLGTEHCLLDEKYRILPLNGTTNWKILEIQFRNQWTALHAFCLDEASLQDCEAYHEDLYRNPNLIPIRDLHLFISKSDSVTGRKWIHMIRGEKSATLRWIQGGEVIQRISLNWEETCKTALTEFGAVVPEALRLMFNESD